jgi:FMN reductase
MDPYQVYAHNRHWSGDDLNGEANGRIERSADVMVQLMRGLSGRTYQSHWDV